MPTKFRDVALSGLRVLFIGLVLLSTGWAKILAV
jgi:hypothetical protein